MAEKTNANIGFEKQLWDAACVLWGHIPAAEYRKVIIGLIFLRYISAAFDRQREKLIAEGDGFEDDRDAYEMDNVFFVPEEARWNNISSKAHTPEIGTIIDNAMRAIEAENKKLKNVLPKNYASPDLDKQVLGDVVDIFTNNIDMSDATASEDLLGRTYEYCIAQFAEKEGVGGGEFYTPSSIVKTLVSILRPFDNCRVYDCCCGSGGMFVQSEKFIEAHGHKRGAISVYGQEANPDTWKMAKMNMAIRGIDADLGPYNADTFTNDLHPTLKADFILANPPFNYHPWNQEKLLEDKRWKYGTPPAGNANYAWIQHMLTNEQVIEELLNLAKQMATANKEGEQLGLTADELAFYDALTKPQAIKDFYENTELIAITKELADTLRKNRTIDWQKRDSARAKMRMMIKRLLKRHRYPPEGMDDAVQTVMTQCELWTDNNDMESA